MAQNIRPPIPPGLIGPRQHPVLPPVNPGVTNGGWVVLPIPGATPAAQPAPLRPTIPHAWLNTEPHWMHRVGKGFVGKRILGRGGFGIVGHWSYEGPDRDQQVLKDVVVKQGLVWRPDWQWGMHFEADMLRQLNKANSSHVLRMYHDLYEEPGFNTDGFDRGLVHRLFLEYCPGGDLDGWSKSHAAANTVPSEEELWGIFHCMARACLVMHKGTEDPAVTPPWPAKEGVHFDLKGENILLGEVTTDTEHRNMPTFKFADFGLARPLAGPPAVQSQQLLYDFSWCGTADYFAPEQIHFSNHQEHQTIPRPWITPLGRVLIHNPRYGSATNIWQTGLIIHCLMTRVRGPVWGGSVNQLQTYTSQLSPRLRAVGVTIGNRNDQTTELQPNMSVYSASLRAAIHEALLVEPASRPTPQELVMMTQRGLDAIRVANTAGLIVSLPPRPPPQPVRMVQAPVMLPPVRPSPPHPATVPLPASTAAPVAAPIFDPALAAQLAAANQVRDAAILAADAADQAADDARTLALLDAQTALNTPAQPPIVTTAAAAHALQILAPLAPFTPRLAPARLAKNIAPAIPSLVPPPITRLQCIVEMRGYLGGRTHKSFVLDNISGDMIVIGGKNMLMNMGCGIQARNQVWMSGRTRMLDVDKLSYFPGLQIVRVSAR